jgi:hypothetical protein
MARTKPSQKKYRLHRKGCGEHECGKNHEKDLSRHDTSESHGGCKILFSNSPMRRPGYLANIPRASKYFERFEQFSYRDALFIVNPSNHFWQQYFSLRAILRNISPFLANEQLPERNHSLCLNQGGLSVRSSNCFAQNAASLTLTMPLSVKNAVRI